MKKDRILQTIVVVQAACLIVLAAVVLTRMFAPGGTAEPAGPAPDPAETADVPASPGTGGAAAAVGGDTISEADYLAELRRQYGGQVLRAMMLRHAVRLEAEALDLRVTAEEMEAELLRLTEGYEDEADYYQAMERQLGMSREDVRQDTEYRLLLEKIAVRDIAVTDEDVDEYIRTHPDEFLPATQVRLSWIVTETREEAEDVLAMAQAGDDFAELARLYSIDEFTADGGGDLGLTDQEDPFLNRDMMEAARGMEVGELGGPVEADIGWAIFQLAERRISSGPAGPERDEAVRRQLALSAAPPLDEVEEDLLAKYEAAVFLKPESGSFSR